MRNGPCSLFSRVLETGGSQITVSKAKGYRFLTNYFNQLITVCNCSHCVNEWGGFCVVSLLSCVVFNDKKGSVL